MSYVMILGASDDFHSELSIDCNNDMDSEYWLRSLLASSVFTHSAPQMDRPQMCRMADMPIAPPMDAMPSSRFIAQSTDRMAVIDTSKKRKKSVERHYERLEKTKEVQERYYYQSTEVFSPVSLVPNSSFWTSFVYHLCSGSPSPFLSKHVILCTHSVSEVLFCLSVCGVDSE